MAHADAPWLAQLLGIRPPWSVQTVLTSADQRVLSVQVGRHRPAPRFWMRRETPPPLRHIRWEHLPILGQRCQVVLALAPDDFVPEAPWTGESGQQFSRALSRQVIDLLLAGATVEQLCVLLRLPVADLWRFKFRLDGGKPAAAVVATTVATTATAVAASTAATSAPAQSATAVMPPRRPQDDEARTRTEHEVPPAASPLWLALLLGRVPLEVRALSLRLLLSKLQREAGLHRDADLHAQAAADLHRYVLRNQSLLGHELAQLRVLSRGAGAAQAGGAQAALPAVTDPLWMELLQGQRALEVRALGLKLLLSKLRGQIDRIHDDDLRMVKLVELHRYFERNQAMLGHELAQIGHWHAH
jgi:hypothetical protein